MMISESSEIYNKVKQNDLIKEPDPYLNDRAGQMLLLPEW